MHGSFSIGTEKLIILCPGCFCRHPKSPVVLRILSACSAPVPHGNGNVEFCFNQRRFARR